jgi:hypothetical protein
MPATPRGPSNWRTDALPPAAGARFEETFGLDRTPESLVDLAVGVRRRLDAAPPGTDELDVGDLYEAPQSPHEVAVGDERRRVRSVVDGLVLPALVPTRVEIETRDPVRSDRVRVTVADGDVRVDPPSAVVSVGAAPDAPRRDSVTAAGVYETLSPYVGVFADERAYRTWAARTDAVTTAVSPADATAVGWALTGRVAGRREPLVDQDGVFSPLEW